MKGAFIVNRYYSDEGMEYVFCSLKTEFDKLGIELVKCSPNLVYDGIDTELNGLPSVDFVVFWDKNVNLAYQIENAGIRVFNCAESIAVCDDKQRTYATLIAKNVRIRIPKTVCAPLMYDNCLSNDEEFLSFVENQLGYPIVIKEDTGSQGRQVYLAENNNLLNQLYRQLKHVNHHYQKLTGKYGEDLRLYMVGSEIAAAYIRKGTGFKSNIYSSGAVHTANPDKKTIETAKEICACLRLDFGAVDFLIDNGEPVFLEANSNAYFTGAEKLGFAVAQKIVSHIAKEVNSDK